MAGLITTVTLGSATGARAEEPTPLAAERARDAERPLLIRPFFSISWLFLDGNQAVLRYPPITSVGASLGWKKLKLSVSKRVNLVQDDPEDAGQTYDTDAFTIALAFSVPVHQRELVITPFYSSVTGMQVELDPGSVEASNGVDIVPRPDLTLRSFGVDALYCLNPAFSYDDRMLELKPREQTAGTFVLRASLGRASLGSDGRPLGAGTLWMQPSLARTAAFDADYADASVGYAFQWIPVGRLAISGLFSVGGTLSHARVTYSDGTGQSRGSQLALKPTYAGNWGIGYIGYTVHFGLMGYYVNEAFAIGDDPVTVQRYSLLLHLGLRL